MRNGEVTVFPVNQGIITSSSREESPITIFCKDVVDDAGEMDDDAEYENDVASLCIDVGR
eukprot:scaffold3545_cov123-Skeletonema_marinoi.AAC.4